MDKDPALPKPRWRFQLHLSTGVIMMFMAGALLWLNLRETATSAMTTVTVGGRTVETGRIELFIRGWPWEAYCRIPPRSGSGPAAAQTQGFWLNDHIAYDAGAAMLILALCAFCGEWRLRRRAKHERASRE